jgi:dTDP-4-amino-4,6-dideoxygalactose transaminase
MTESMDARLAADGGPPVRTAPLPSWPCYEKSEISAAAEVLRSGNTNYWSGDECRKFEEEFAASCGAKHGVALANGSVALELALHALQIGPGDEVVVPARTFIASASCAILRGARPVFCDVDPVSQNATAETIRRHCTAATKAIIVVHLAGWPCEMDGIMELAKGLDLKVVEDCAQAHGATYKGYSAGSFGHAAAFSFCNDKILTTGGEGGMLITNDRSVWERAWSYKDHGKSYDAVYRRKHAPGFRWLHESFGTNWRMTEFQAAIGRAQLRRLREWVAARRRNAEALARCFSTIPALRTTEPPGHVGHSYYKYFVFLRRERLREGWNRDRVMAAINAEGVSCLTGFCPEVYLERAFEKGGLRPPERLPVAKELGESSLMFPVHPPLGDREIGDICRATEKVLCAAAY